MPTWPASTQNSQVLTIGQLASYAGVTAKTVRHYHAKGLLPEPERDHSGYRRYDATAVVDLIKIRTLAKAGVPLTRVQALLQAGDEEFAAAVADIDRRLRAEIRERHRHRERIAQLAAGDYLALPTEVVAYLDRLRSLDLPSAMIDAERDAWILVAAQMPEQMPFYMELKQRQLDDPSVLGLYRELGDALGWEIDDPRVDRIADHIVELLEAGDAAPAHGEPDDMDDQTATLLDSVFIESVPIARQLMSLIEKRGWTGWTKNKRITT